MVMVLSRRHKILPAKTLEILAFDAGKVMCRLVCLYHSLSDGEISRLRKETIKSKGVAYLTSHQECFLLNLAAGELLEDLDDAAVTVSQLGRKCSDVSLSRFDLVYHDLKHGITDLKKLGYGTRSANKVIGKMEKLVAATGNLYTALEAMAELEASEKKMQRWNNNCNKKFLKPNVDYLNEKIEIQRKQVQQYKELSLWNQTFDKTVGIMAKVVCIVYARICSVFGACVSFSSHKNNDKNLDSSVYCLLQHRVLYQNNLCLSEQYHRSSGGGDDGKTKSGPLFSKANKLYPVSFHSGVLKADREQFIDKSIKNEKCGNVLKLAPPNTVGGASLTFRYANVILFAERCFNAPAKGARETLYEMLPEKLRAKVRTKLKGRRKKEGGRRDECDALADGWREAVGELLDWILPVAHDTVRWHNERLLDKKPFEVGPKALLLQTMHYSDLEKVETTIVEVLVGLSYIHWYEKRL